jgi:hypothetical protein
MVFRYDGIEGEEFKRVHVRSIEPGDCLFEMSDELRDEIEQALTPVGGRIESSPARKVLALYHSFVKNALDSLFPASSKQASVRSIHSRMVELDPEAKDVSAAKLTYWISLDEDDGVPHGARDQEEFLLFTRALQIEPTLANEFWGRIRRVRYENQTEGRQLKAIYAEILFSPESVQVYQRMAADVILSLRTKALSCVFNVAEIEPPRN